MDIQIGKVYRHFKGNYYYVENIARNSETQEDYVVYRPLYSREDASLWIRPLSMFLEKIDSQNILHTNHPLQKNIGERLTLFPIRGINI